MLNNCPVARELRRYNARHDVVLKEIAAAIQPYLSPSSVLSIDIHDTDEFSLHIVSTDLRPDIVWWNTQNRSLSLVELTVCFENNFEDAARRKTAKYTDLVDQACTNGYNATLLTLVGSRGVPHYESFAKLATVLHMPARDLMNLLRNVMSSHHWLFYYLVFQEQIIIATCHLLLCFFFFFLSFRKLWQFGPYFIFLWYQVIV